MSSPKVISIRRELETRLGSRLEEESEFNIIGSTYFQQLVSKLVNDIAGDEDFPPEWAHKQARGLFPLVNFLTRPRSIDEFQQLKRSILEILSKVERKNIRDKSFWLPYLLLDFRIFPCSAQIDFGEEGIPMDNIWKMYEEVTEVPLTEPAKKIISVVESFSVRERALGDEVRFGLTFGKFRMGTAHSGYRESFRKAKQALGVDGVLLVCVEKKESILRRLGENSACLDDRERIKQIAENPEVDFVCLVGTNRSDEETIRLYYDVLWSRIRPQYYFMGERKILLQPIL